MLQIRVREAAEDHNITQAELANAMNISVQSMSKNWRGNKIRWVDQDKLEEISRVLKVPVLSLNRKRLTKHTLS